MRIRFSDKMHDVLALAAEEALRTGYKTAGVDHLMLGLLRHRDNNACRALKNSGIDLDMMKHCIDEQIFRDTATGYNELETVHPTKAAQEVLKISGYEALKSGSHTVRTAHFMLAISRSEGNASSNYLKSHNVIYDTLRSDMEKKGMLRDIAEHAPSAITEEIAGALGEQLSRLISSSGSELPS